MEFAAQRRLDVAVGFNPRASAAGIGISRVATTEAFEVASLSRTRPRRVCSVEAVIMPYGGNPSVCRSPPSLLSDFLGRVYLTLVPGSRRAGLFESEVKFEAVEPGHAGIDMLGGKFVREALVVGAE